MSSSSRMCPLWKLLILSLVLCLQGSDGWSAAVETTLRSDLLTPYEKAVRPDETTEIFLTFQMTSLDSIEIKDQVMIVSGWWKMEWTDSRLSWTSASYNNIQVIQVYEDDIWTPALVVTNSLNDLSAIDEDTIPLRVDSTGTIQWSPPGHIEASCDIDATFFPFDIQTCSIELTSFGYSLNELNINTTDGLLMNYYSESGDWDIRDTDVSRTVYFDAGRPYAKLSFDITAKRKSSYYWINIILPIVINGILIGFVFLLPTESGEKMGYSLTCLLAYVVLLTLLAGDMPTSAKHTPLLEVYITIVLGLSAASVLLAILNNKIYFTDESRPVPKFYLRFTQWAIRVLRDDHYKVKSGKVQPMDGGAEPSHAQYKAQATPTYANRHNTVTPVRKMSVLSNESGQSSEYCEITWQIVAQVMDAFFFRVYALFITLFSIVFLFALALGQL